MEEQFPAPWWGRCTADSCHDVSTGMGHGTYRDFCWYVQYCTALHHNGQKEESNSVGSMDDFWVFSSRNNLFIFLKICVIIKIEITNELSYENNSVKNAEMRPV